MTFWTVDKRKTQQAIKTARLYVLQQIDQLNTQRCEQCRSHARDSNVYLCACEASVEIRRLGTALNMGREYLVKTYEELLQVAVEARTEVITVEAYKVLKEQGLSDRKIGIRYDMDNNAIQKFKRENGLIKPRAEKVERSDEEQTTSIKDLILQTIEGQIDAQTEKGIGKYSHSLDDCPADKYDWQQMINEELIDALQYQQKEISRLRESAGLTLDQYQEISKRTAVTDDLAMLNYGLGISGEAGEVADLIKKYHFHGHRGDNLELAKELGDVLWYISQIAREADLTLSAIAEGNIEKLRRRYPDGFNESASVNRSE